MSMRSTLCHAPALSSRMPSHIRVQPSSVSSNSMSVRSIHAANALARYLKQQAADRLSVQQRGAALREAEQEARSRAAVEATRVLDQLEAEARRKIAMAVCPEAGAHLKLQQHRASTSLHEPGVTSSSNSRPYSSRRHHSKSAVWPASSTGSSSVYQSNGPMHLGQQTQQQQHQHQHQQHQHQQQSCMLSQAGDRSCQPVAAGLQCCCLQERPPETARPTQQPRQQAWQQQQPDQLEQQHRQHQDLQHGDTQQPVQQQWHQPRPPGQRDQPPHAWRPHAGQHDHRHAHQHLLGPRRRTLSSSSSSSSTSGSPRQCSTGDSCRPVTAGGLLQPLLPQQPCSQSVSSDGTAAAEQQGSVVLRRPGSPIAQALNAIACHAAVPRVAGSADPLKEPLLGQ